MKIDREWLAIVLGLALAGFGWKVGADLLALAGTLGACTAFLLWVWQRECLTGVSYRRTLSQHRAVFGEQVHLDVEFVNDKLLPLTWLHVSDTIAPGLTIHGDPSASVRDDDFPRIEHLLPLLPYARVRRRLTIECDRRGEHSFGPAQLRSGNPLGYRTGQTSMRDRSSLLVYPKLFQLTSTTLLSRVSLGDERSRLELLGDPSRPIGVRDYRVGDPIRHINWRATARSAGLLVRVFEPTSSLRVAVFADTQPPRRSRTESSNADVEEFCIALTASVVAELARRGVATGLYSSATVERQVIACGPSTSAAALPLMLEQLARCTAWSQHSISELLITEGARLGRGATTVLIAAQFSIRTLAAVAELRRRMPVTLIWVATDNGTRPPVGSADVQWEVNYRSDWKDIDVVELAR
jgi:uncharacterized protein (DUF58 family)